MPDDRTNEETAVGFRYDSDADAVVYDLPGGERLIRSHAPNQSVQYRVARFGRWPTDNKDEKPSWKPIHSGLENQPPDSAIRWAKDRLEHEPEMNVIPPDTDDEQGTEATR